MVRKLSFLVSFFILCGCSIKSREEQAELKEFFNQKQFVEAQAYLDASSLKSEPEHKLLYLMEQGTLYYYQKEYNKAARTFVKANELVDELYTKSIRELLAASIINDNSETFYGSIFERSLLYYYQAMSFYQLAMTGHYFETKMQDGKEVKTQVELSRDQIRSNFNRVRSSLIAWDSFFQEMGRLSGAKTILRYDLLAKQVAADLHRALGSKRDNEIALQLYRDALGILEKIGPAFSAYNKTYKEYNLQLREKFDGDRKTIEKKVINPTKNYQATKAYLSRNILALVKKLRPYNYEREKRKFALKNEELKNLPLNPVQVIVETDTITSLEGKDFVYNLRTAIEGIEDPGTRAVVNGIGIPILTYFAMGPLGLGFISHHGNVSIYSHHGIGETMAKEVGIEFELPYVKESAPVPGSYLQVFQGDKLITEKKLILNAPLNDVAFINAQERIENSFKKRATRVGTKYVLAIIAAYTTYQKMRDTSGELFARPAAFAQFLVSQKGIKESEKADTRHWSTLPGYLFKSNLNLAPGEYTLKFIQRAEGKNQGSRDLSLGNITVIKGKPALFSFRSF